MSDIINSIKSGVLGIKANVMDNEIDSALKSIEKYSINSDKNQYMDTINKLVSKTNADMSNPVLKNMRGEAQIQNFDQTGRLSRYAEYDSIVKKISYCQRALECLTDNILSPDDITKRCVQYVVSDTQLEKSSDIENLIARCKRIEFKIKLDEHIKRITKTTLKKGDNFVEIVISPKGENALTVIQESNNNEVLDFGDMINDTVTYEYTPEGTKQPIAESINVNLSLECLPSAAQYIGIPTNQVLTEDDDRFKSKYSKVEDDKSLDLKDVFIAIHDPKYIIRLETERFKSCLGYLVFPKLDPKMITNGALMTSGNDSVNNLCQDIINQLHTQLKSSNDKIKMSDDLRKSVLNYLGHVKKGDDLKVRYVPPELMVHWRINQDCYDPYGESIFDCVNFDCRLLMALKTAKTIKQLSFATDKRVVAVETGLPRDARNIVESIKEGISKNKYSIDNMGSIDTIPSQIPTFETIYIPMRDGKRFVEIDNQQWGQNPQEDVENLKFIRDNIVANMGVPAPYLGLEENMSNRSLLTVENINFCRTIISFQKELSIPLKEMFAKIISIVYPESSDHMRKLEITFPEPKISPYEHQMEYVEQMQRLIEALKTLGVPESWLKKKYLPNINWDEVESYTADQKIKQETGEMPPDQNDMGGMGGMY
jgi:hypothetical protein